MKKITINGIVQLIRLAAQFGIKQAALLEGSGISPKILTDPHAVIQPEQEFTVVRNLRAASDQPALGLIVGRYFHLSVLGYLGAATANAATVSEAIRFFNRYINLSYTYFNVRFTEDHRGGKILLKDKTNLGVLRRFFLERDVMFTLTALRDMIPNETLQKRVQVQFGFESPPNTQVYRQMLQCPVSFAEGETQLLLDRSLLNHPLPQANDITFKLLAQQCESIKKRMEGGMDLREQIMELILRSLPHRLTLDNLSDQLHISSRTIRRRLRQEGVHYRDLINGVLDGEAKRLLRESHWSVDQIAEALGYCEAAAFIHAFKSWTTCTPAQWRKQSVLDE